MTTLDALYSAWSVQRDNDTLNDLILAVRDGARYYFKRFGAESEDMAQDVAILILGKLPGFVPESEQSFSRWVSAILRRKKLKQYSAHQHVSSDDLVEQEPEHDRYLDISNLPPFMKEASALFLLGFSVEETAEQMKLTPAALRKKIQRYRASMS